MSSDQETEFVGRLRQQLDRHADQLDEVTASRLRAARRRALEANTRRAFRWLPVSGVAAAAAALLAVLVWQQHSGDLAAVQEDWDILAAGEELELIEELEFYDWLEQTQSRS
jgi:hypothetical protein